MSKIIPYVMTDDGWSIPESIMTGIFLEMRRLGLVDVVFANGGVQNVMNWMQFVQNTKNVVHIVGNEKEIEMVAWLNSFGLNYAFAHFCAFPSSWGRNTVEVGRLSLEYWFNMPVIDVVLGQIPLFNKQAIDYTKRVGMIEVGTVPNIKYKKEDAITGSYFCYLTREEFENG